MRSAPLVYSAQSEVINQAFTPSDEDIEYSRIVVDLFEQNPGIGTVWLDARMLDMPHLKQARNVLDPAKQIRAVA